MAHPARAGNIAKTSTGAINVSTIDVAMPAGVTAGDGIIVEVSFDQNPTLSIDAASSAGWVKLGQVASGTTAVAAWFWLPEAIGGGSDNLRVASTIAERGTALAQRITGHDPDVTPNIAMASGAAGANACNPPNLAPAAGSKDYLWIAGCGLDQATAAEPTAGPAGYVDFDVQAGPTQGAHSGWAYNAATAASEDPGTFTHPSAAWMAATIAIHPAPAGGTTYNDAPSGGIVLGGTTTTERVFSNTPAGGLVLGGTVSTARELGSAPAGGIVLGGSAAAALEASSTPVGGLILGGVSTSTRELAVTPAGGIVLDGSAPSSSGQGYADAPAGGIVLGGVSTTSRDLGAAPSGGVVLGGVATSDLAIVFSATPAGGLVLGGVASAGIVLAATPAGGIVLGGTVEAPAAKLVNVGVRARAGVTAGARGLGGVSTGVRARG